MNVPPLPPDEVSSHPLSPLSQRLRALADDGIHVGTYSWRYEGWVGKVYSPERYWTRGKFSKKRFHEECLREFAEIFPTSCGDFSFYSFPSEEEWRKIFDAAPQVRFGFKVPERITVRRWPFHPRYGAKRGQFNDAFLNLDLFQRLFLDRLEPHRHQVGVIVLEFGTFAKTEFADVRSFVAELAPFLGALPAGWRFAVETRNKEFFEPAYFDCLKNHGAAHVFNAWTRVPDLVEQVSDPQTETTDLFVSRAMLRPGRTFAQATAMFEPYAELKEPDEVSRRGLRMIIDRARTSKKGAFVFVSNRLEGHSPGTIDAVTQQGLARVAAE